MRDGQRPPEGWLKPGEKWPGQNDGLPEPGTKASEEYHREQFGKDRPPRLEARKSPKR